MANKEKIKKVCIFSVKNWSIFVNIHLCLIDLQLENKLDELNTTRKQLKGHVDFIENQYMQIQAELNTLLAPLTTIFVETPSGSTNSFIVKPTDTIESVKAKILDEKHRLVFGGRELKNGRTLSDCNIKHKSKLHLEIREPSQIFVGTFHFRSRAQ